MPHISIKAEPIFELGGIVITNSVLTSLIVLVAFFFIARYYSQTINKKKKSSFFYVIHGIIDTIYTLYSTVLKEKTTIFFPLLGTFFLFILLNNWAGLIPGVGSLLIKVHEHGEVTHVPLFRGATADLNTTIALALISVVLTQYFGFKYLGTKDHLKKYANAMGPLEAFSELSRVLSFSFRLFGNIFAGEVMLSIVAFLLPVITPPFFLMEIFVGFIQAIVFSMLTAVFINLAIAKHH